MSTSSLTKPLIGFNPRAPRGTRHRRADVIRLTRKRFNPRAPRGTRPVWVLGSVCPSRFQSTRPARDATAARSRKVGNIYVSIHAPRAGRDAGLVLFLVCGGAFQSTRPARDATHFAPASNPLSSRFNPRAPRGTRLFVIPKFRFNHSCFNPRAPRGTRPRRDPCDRTNIPVSIHAPRAGRDVVSGGICRGRVPVSIHAPRAGRDR